jgi:hypothetical protein
MTVFAEVAVTVSGRIMMRAINRDNSSRPENAVI